MSRCILTDHVLSDASAIRSYFYYLILAIDKNMAKETAAIKKR